MAVWVLTASHSLFPSGCWAWWAQYVCLLSSVDILPLAHYNVHRILDNFTRQSVPSILVRAGLNEQALITEDNIKQQLYNSTGDSLVIKTQRFPFPCSLHISLIVKTKKEIIFTPWELQFSYNVSYIAPHVFPALPPKLAITYQ